MLQPKIKLNGASTLIKMKILLIFVILILADRDTYPINVASDCASAKLLQSEINTEFIMLTEQFKSIKGYEGLYEVSNYGNVRSKTGRLRKLYKSKLKYYVLPLSKNSKVRAHYVHHLVWDNFGVEKRNGFIKTVDHIDGDPLNNYIDNLQLSVKKLK